MSSLRLVTLGATSSLQDGGRPGHARFGVPRSGPVDRLSHRLAARLAGAAAIDVATTVALEVGPHPCTVEAAGPVVLAVAGAATHVSGGSFGEVAAPCVVRLADGDRATITATTWAYVVPSAPIDAQLVLGSSSTHGRSGLGPQLEGDACLELGEPRQVAVGRRRPPPRGDGPLALLAGPQCTEFTVGALRALIGESFRTTSSFDRMGHRLDGPELVARAGHDIVSDGIVPGALQVPGDGRPFVLTADHQTTGGYPKIAVLTTASLARFVRLAPGSEVRFRWSDAVQARSELTAAVDAIEACVAGPLTPTAGQLADENLVGGVTDGT